MRCIPRVYEILCVFSKKAVCPVFSLFMFCFSPLLILYLQHEHLSRFFFVACTRLNNPLCPSVGRLVCHTLLFFMILFLGPHCSCPRCLVTSNMAPAHPHATSVAVYPALFFFKNFVRCLSYFSKWQKDEIKKNIFKCLPFKNEKQLVMT